MMTKQELRLLRDSCRENKKEDVRSPQEIFSPEEVEEFLNDKE